MIGHVSIMCSKADKPVTLLKSYIEYHAVKECSDYNLRAINTSVIDQIDVDLCRKTLNEIDIPVVINMIIMITQIMFEIFFVFDINIIIQGVVEYKSVVV